MNKKIKHKHEYKQCLLEFKNSICTVYNIATYCTICGRIGKRTAFEKDISEDGKYRRILYSDDIYEKYKNKLEIFNNISKDFKYVILNKE